MDPLASLTPLSSSARPPPAEHAMVKPRLKFPKMEYSSPSRTSILQRVLLKEIVCCQLMHAYIHIKWVNYKLFKELKMLSIKNSL